jgi:hypothetical protein
MEKPELARQSFVRVLELEENGAVADAARYLLEDLSISGSAN